MTYLNHCENMSDFVLSSLMFSVIIIRKYGEVWGRKIMKMHSAPAAFMIIRKRQKRGGVQGWGTDTKFHNRPRTAQVAGCSWDGQGLNKHWQTRCTRLKWTWTYPSVIRLSRATLTPTANNVCRCMSKHLFNHDTILYDSLQKNNQSTLVIKRW